MRIIIKQQQFIDELIRKAKERFPEILLMDIQESPDDPEQIWINVIADMEEDREFDLREYTSELENDILMKYGYYFAIMPENPNKVYTRFL